MYYDRAVTEATLQLADEYGSVSEALRISGHETLYAIAHKPTTLAAIRRARLVADKHYWKEICTNKWETCPLSREVVIALDNVLATMPGYCCANDACNIIARSDL